MRPITLALAAIALLGASAAMAQGQPRTRTFDSPAISGSQTASVDRAAGTQSRDTAITRNRDGATASSSMDRSWNDGSVTTNREQTDFQGRTRSSQTTRTRTETGSTMTGTATGRDGETYALSGERNRTETGYTASQTVTNSSGETVYARDTAVSRDNGMVNRSVETSRMEGAAAPRRARR